MAIEIERKWLIKSVPKEILDLTNPVKIMQGYIAVHEDKTEVRIRQFGDAYWQTIKSPGHISRQEFEMPISKELFDQLYELTKGRQLIKQRHIVPLGSLTIELDEYMEDLKGLWVAEVEFSSMELANSFTAPTWFAEEISGVSKYKNFVLASKGLQP
jgi:CYTH domain-containing protein